jgi:redox-sensitive bicupin YhaK (pirin superfamily)
MLDFFGSDKPGEYIAGFPPHPHRGFQTVTYMLAGKMRHKDSVGNEGVIEAGGIQWMNAGKGIIHEEMPEQQEGLLKGFQLWVNLPASEKMSAPNYQDISPSSVPSVAVGDAMVKVLAGVVDGVAGPVKTTAVAPTFVDVSLAAGEVSLPVSAADSAFIYVYQGDVRLLDSNETHALTEGELGVLTQKGDNVHLTTESETKFIMVTGKPINEPVVQYGPFVMNTQAEIMQAFNDYQNGSLASA